MNNWKRDFESLYNNTSAHQNMQVPENNNNMSRNTHGTTNEQYGSTRVNALNTGITEVKEAVKSLHKNRAVGQDQLPAEVLQSDSCIFFLHRRFCACFDAGKILKEWQYGIINPILKDSTPDKRIPLNYKGITVTSSVYNAYCSILNRRLTKWVEANDILSDAQNGFRQNRSTVDHLSSITSIIENRKKLKKAKRNPFLNFIYLHCSWYCAVWRP